MTSPTHCIILCGGENTRWGGHRETRCKHLIEVEGELLLDRTLRLVAAREPITPTHTVVVVNENDLGVYASSLSGAPELYGISHDIPNETEAYKFLSSKALWNADGRTVVLLGDVWFSDAAIGTIFDDSREDWTAFGRAGASRFTGCRHGELFAQSFTSFEEHAANLERLDAMYRQGTCRRAASGWAHYQLMIGKDPDTHTVGPRFVAIDDFTEDFDRPGDYESWVLGRSANRAAHRTPVRSATPKTGRNELCSCGSGKKFKKCCGR
ncbi:MAG: SEC-C metal-binding domain-containing protein [bacterium]